MKKCYAETIQASTGHNQRSPNGRASTRCRCPVAPGGGTGPTVSVLAFVGRVPPRGAGSASDRQLRDAPLSWQPQPVESLRVSDGVGDHEVCGRCLGAEVGQRVPMV